MMEEDLSLKFHTENYSPRWMNGMIFVFQNCIGEKKRNQFVALDVDSMALRHTLVYGWETL